jgi:Ni/Co efflux regulator RcnB
MKMMTIRLLLALLLCGAIGAPILRAQDAQGSGMETTDKQTKRHWWNHHKKQKSEKVAKHGKHEKAEPLYKTPRSLSRWHGGGPAPAGAGTK